MSLITTQVPTELIHRPPGLDPLGPIVHAWTNILEHPTGEERDFDARYQQLRSRSLDGRDGDGVFGYEGRGEPHAYDHRGRRLPPDYDYSYEPRGYRFDGGYGYPVGGNVPNEMGAGTAFCPVCEAFARYSGHSYRGHSSRQHQLALEEGAAPTRGADGPQWSHVAEDLDDYPRRLQVHTLIYICSVCAL